MRVERKRKLNKAILGLSGKTTKGQNFIFPLKINFRGKVYTFLIFAFLYCWAV